MQNRLLIAVTGGMGSGKSGVISALKAAGYATLDCDQITKELYLDPTVINELSLAFPTAVLPSGKGVCKKEIARVAFADPAAYARLKQIVTDRVFLRVQELTEGARGLVFVEVPLLFEGGYQDYFDKTIVVLRNKEARIRAVKERSNLSEGEIVARLKKQVDYDGLDFTLPEYKDCIIIRNDRGLAELSERALKIAKNLQA